MRSSRSSSRGAVRFSVSSAISLSCLAAGRGPRPRRSSVPSCRRSTTPGTGAWSSSWMTTSLAINGRPNGSCPNFTPGTRRMASPLSTAPRPPSTLPRRRPSCSRWSTASSGGSSWASRPPSLESLTETMKYQNTKCSLLESVKMIQNAGLLVYGGFIIGFDHDSDDIFDRQIEFITQAAIPNAMVGLLVALPGTPLYKRMQETGRLKPEEYEGTSDQCGYTNMVTRLPARQLLEGYRKVIATIYTPHEYFSRSVDALSRLPHPDSLLARIHHVLSLQRANGLLILRHLRAKKATKERAGLLRKLTSLYSL